MEEKEVGLHQITLRYTDGVYHGTKSYPQARLTTYDVRLCVRFADRAQPWHRRSTTIMMMIIIDNNNNKVRQQEEELANRSKTFA